jgi:hypothetical protein
MLDVQRRARPQKRRSEPDEPALDRNCASVESLLERRFEKEPLAFLAPDTLNTALSAFVQEGDKDAFQRQVGNLIRIRVAFLIEKVPEGDALSLEQAERLIDDNKADLPVFQQGGERSQRRETATQPPESAGDARRRTRQKLLADEDVDTEPARPRRKVKKE